MRVSALLSLAAMLATISMAESPLNRRQLGHEYDASESRSEYYTLEFNYDQDSHGKDETYEGYYQIGLILGFITTGCFMTFGVITLIWDECNRHKNFKEQVRKDEFILRNNHNCSEDAMESYKKEFADRERLRNKSKAERDAEREALAEIN